jgi:hypothetical protein
VDWSVAIYYPPFIFRPFTRALFYHLSAAGFAKVVVMLTPPEHVYYVVAKNKVKLFMEGYAGGHIIIYI